VTDKSSLKRIRSRFGKAFPKRGVSRQIVSVVFGDGLTTLSLLLPPIVLARVISQETMATYRQVAYLGPLIVYLAEFSVSASIYRFWRFYDLRTRKAFLRLAFKVALGLGIIGSLATLALAGPLAAAYANPALRAALWITCAYPLSQIPFMLVRPTLISEGFPLRATLLETGFALGGATALIIPLWQGASLNRALGFWMGANLFRLPIAAALLRPFLQGAPRHCPREVRQEVWRYVWPLHLSRLPGILRMYTDKIATSLFLNLKDFAVYSLGAREIPFLNRIAFSMSSVLIPQMVECLKKGDIERMCKYWRKAALSTALLTYPLAAFAIWYAKPAMVLLFSSSYEGSALPFRAFSALTFIRVIEYGSLAKVLNRNQLVMASASIALGINIATLFPLTRFWGIRGACLATVVSAASSVVYYLVVYRGLIARPIRSFFPYIKLASVLCAAFLAVWLASQLLDPWLQTFQISAAVGLAWRLAATGVASGILYILIIWRISKFWIKDSKSIGLMD